MIPAIIKLGVLSVKPSVRCHEEMEAFAVGCGAKDRPCIG
jgi:hypothetical protein